LHGGQDDPGAAQPDSVPRRAGDLHQPLCLFRFQLLHEHIGLTSRQPSPPPGSLPGVKSPLIEVAARRPNRGRRREALRRYLHDAQTFIGVLVTVEPNEPTWEFAGGTAIVTLGVDFLESIEVDALTRLLINGWPQPNS
jgi:hypothetical protein